MAGEKKATTAMPKCVGCGRRKSVRRVSDFYRCTMCGVWFDGDPDEGGDYHADPSKRMEKQEERRRRA